MIYLFVIITIQKVDLLCFLSISLFLHWLLHMSIEDRTYWIVCNGNNEHPTNIPADFFTFTKRACTIGITNWMFWASQGKISHSNMKISNQSTIKASSISKTSSFWNMVRVRNWRRKLTSMNRKNSCAISNLGRSLFYYYCLNYQRVSIVSVYCC